MLMQAIVLLAIFLGLRKATRAASQELEELRTTVLPFVKDAREFFTRVAPKIEQTSSDVAAVAQALRKQTDNVQSAATEIVERARRQASRLDTMATSVLDAADRTGAFITGAVEKPMRQLSGILASIKAVLETFRAPQPAPRPRADRPPGDPEMFV
ncbi:MAG: hypothetical protein WBE72_14215 [Terracidiphilus sp.]